ncbi:hypothetical protein D2Q93_06060 [Alicyclobacillaceae bacterium I2511]|nr:hypothetical protein D2Q93_06060 [Alicyclobacillaceae bacterium I2511]
MEKPWPSFVSTVLQTLQKSGFEAMLVGGCVRDGLLQRRARDYDVATNATPHQVMSLFPKTASTGIQHGTVTVISKGQPIEVTTYRVDLGYSDGRHPEKVCFTPNLVEDLARRDFTINAIAQDLQGRFIDPYQGRVDLGRQTIRCVGSPTIRFQEDSLRILRALRLAAELAFSIEKTTFYEMLNAAPLLAKLPGERVGQELWRLAAAGHWFEKLQSLANITFWEPLGPAVSSLQPGLAALSRENEIHQKAWLTVPENPEDSQQRALAALITWLWAGKQSLESAEALARHCGWSKAIGNTLTHTLAMMQDDPAVWSILDWRIHLYEGPRESLGLACRILDWFAGLDPGAANSRWRLCQKIWDKHPLQTPRALSITGEDLIHLGLQGQNIGQVKKALVAAVLSERCPNQRQSLLTLAREISQPLAYPQNEVLEPTNTPESWHGWEQG